MQSRSHYPLQVICFDAGAICARCEPLPLATIRPRRGPDERKQTHWLLVRPESRRVKGFLRRSLRRWQGNPTSPPSLLLCHRCESNSEILIGDFRNKLVSFLLIAAALYFFVVTPFNAIVGREPGEAPSGDDKEIKMK